MPAVLFIRHHRPRSRQEHLVVTNDATEKGALAFLAEVVAAFPYKLTHILTDRGSCFTGVLSRRCGLLGIPSAKDVRQSDS
jgi:hypothetical protein